MARPLSHLSLSVVLLMARAGGAVGQPPAERKVRLNFNCEIVGLPPDAGFWTPGTRRVHYPQDIFSRAQPMPTAAQKPFTDRVTAMFRACSDATRLRILSLLRSGEACVGDLATVLDVPQPSASRHLAYLRRAGLVTARRDEQWVHYALAPARDGAHAKLLDLLAVLADGPEARGDARRAARLRAEGGCCPAGGETAKASRRRAGGGKERWP
jgi:ArsR family transcriptional regulator